MKNTIWLLGRIWKWGFYFAGWVRILSDSYDSIVPVGLVYDEDRLRVISEPVLEREDYSKLIGKMKDVLRANGATGLSAIQLGVRKRIAVIYQGNEVFTEFINPEIIHKEQPARVKKEGCLSFPGQTMTTIRYREVEVKDAVRTRQLTGWLAFAIQHEIDHMNGILFMDRRAPEIQSNKMERNALCKCGSGKKYKRCCGRG